MAIVNPAKNRINESEYMADIETGMPAVLFNKYIIMCYSLALVVAAFEGAVSRGYISFSLSGAVSAAKNILLIVVIFVLLLRYVRSVFPPAGGAGSVQMAAAYIAHMIKTALIVGIPLKIVIWLYLKLASDDFGIDPVAAFNGNGWLSLSYNAVIVSILIIGFAIINNTNSSPGSLVKSLRFIFTLNGAIAVSVLAAFFILISFFDYFQRLIEYRTIISLIVDSIISPLRYYLLYFVVYAVSAIVARKIARNHYGTS